ncbi:MAG: IS1634 family transposase [bacterium]
MYIRKTVKKVKGKKYIQHQLIESIRTPKGPRQNVILNFGTLDLEETKWKNLANAIENKLHNNNQLSLFPIDEEIEKLAQHYSQVIIKERLNKEGEKIKKDKEKEEAEYTSVDVSSVNTSEVRSIGGEHVIVSQMKEYKVDKILREIGLERKEIEYAKVLMAGRLVHPGSERETARWVNENSGLLELMGSNEKVHDTGLHKVAKLLWKRHEEIEDKLAEEAKRIFSLKETILLYDLTNTYFEGSKRESKIAYPGRSKERRNDRPLVTLALVIDGEGFPKKSKVLEGNVSEPKTLKGILSELPTYDLGYPCEKTIVIDAGIASEENLKLIAEEGFKYVAVSRKQKYEEDFWKDSQSQDILLSDQKSKLEIKSVRTEEEVYLLCQSEAKAAKEKSILTRKMKKFEESLSNLRKGLKEKKTQKNYGKINERIGRLKEKYGIGNLYDIEVTGDGKIAQGINFRKNPKGEAKEQRIGEYVLRTNQLDLTDEEISRTHRTLSQVEESFRSMKSELGIRPIYHQKDEMSAAHIFITVLGYHLLAGILRKLKDGGITYCWNSVRNILLNHSRITTTFNVEDGSTISVRTTSVATVKQKEVYDILKINHKPLKRIKIKIPLKKGARKDVATQLKIENKM